MNKQLCWKSFRSGIVRVSPLALGVVPFGLMCGVSAVNVGIPASGAVSMSLIIFAGASQLVMTQLMANDVSIVVVILTGVLINLRMFMYSASLSAHLGSEPVLKRMGIAYLMTDQAFATSVHAYEDSQAKPLDKAMFYIGAGLFMWFVFVSSTWIGALSGKTIPKSWDLDFAVPLTFIALMVLTIKSKLLLRVAIIGGGTAIVLHFLPYNSGLILGAFSGVFFGWLIERRAGYECD